MKKNMKEFKLLIIFLVGFSLCNTSFAQETQPVLTLEEAIRTALEKNHDIKISEKSTDILVNNAVKSNAGYLPTVAISGVYNYQNENTYSEFNSTEIPPIDVNNAETQTFNAGINLNYSIYSGGSRKYRFEKLQNQLLVGELQERQKIETTISLVVFQYLNLINFNKSYEINKEAIMLSTDRYNRVKDSYSYGSISKLELLNAEVDLSNDSSTLVQAELDYFKAKNELNVLMGLSPEIDFRIDSTINLQKDLELQTFIDKALTNNSQYLAQKALAEGALSDLRVNNAQKLPNLSLSGGYNYARTEFGASFIRLSENLGWTAGLTLSYNVFDGNRVRRNEQNALLQIESQEIGVDKVEKNIQKEIYNAFQDYESGMSLIKLRKSNLKLAETNFDRSREAFSSGQINGIQLREAQLNLLNAKYTLTLQTLVTKRAEVNLYLLSGALVEY